MTTRKRPPVPKVTLTRADRTDAIDIIAQPVADQVYDQEHGWIATDQTAIDIPTIDDLEQAVIDDPPTPTGDVREWETRRWALTQGEADAWRHYANHYLPRVTRFLNDHRHDSYRHADDFQALQDTRVKVAHELINQASTDDAQRYHPLSGDLL